MNRRLIGKMLANKHKKFIETIDDEDVRKLVNENSIITGGAIASMLIKEDVSDFDYYFTNKETVIAVANYYVKKFIEAHPEGKTKPIVEIETDEETGEETGRVKIRIDSKGILKEEGFGDAEEREATGLVESISELDEIDAEALEDKEKPPYRPVYLSSNAITLSDKIQLIIRFYGSQEEVHENFDFIHCKNSWISKTGELILDPRALESLLAKQLYYCGSLYPVCSIIRTRKFLKRGWHINAGQYLKMCFQVSELDLHNIRVLEEQLVGVDSAYFQSFIEYCKERMDEEEDFKLTTPYLISVVDKIF